MQLFNSLTGKIEKFKLFKKDKVTIYVCGITPYDTTHLGHAFVYISFDALIRYLQYKGFKINYTQNVTDIDDDVLKKAAEQDRDWQELGKFWTDKFLNDLKFLNILMPTHYVKATDSIKKIIKIVSDLNKRGLAYEKQGNIYFEVNKFKDYGQLSKYTKKQMLLISKERGSDPSDPNKRDPLDFILWQKTKTGEPFWESPWGKGRPGWHIECSAMVNTYLGDQIDIHGGGRDLIYPHHESEIAQSESFTGKKPFVGNWMHIGMVLYEGEKMAKSLGNLVMVSDLSKKYSSNIIRWLLLSHYYRKPWEFDYAEIEEIREKVILIEKFLKKSNESKINKQHLEVFDEMMDDDLNTPRVLDFVLSLLGNQENKITVEKMLEILGFNFSS
jgi:L-cysteine:1D-myo-inositol 2-amino-2-deoxy-alpha-D-glucopyranoside ligase